MASGEHDPTAIPGQNATVDDRVRLIAELLQGLPVAERLGAIANLSTAVRPAIAAVLAMGLEDTMGED